MRRREGTMQLLSLLILLLAGSSVSSSTTRTQPRAERRELTGVTENFGHQVVDISKEDDGDHRHQEKEENEDATLNHRRVLLGVSGNVVDGHNDAASGRPGRNWRRTLHAVTGGPGGAPVLVTYASGGYWKLVRGWVAGLLSRGVTRFVVIPADGIAAAALEAVVPGHVLYLESEEEAGRGGGPGTTNTDTSHADFGSQQFHAYVANKAVFMRMLLEEGYHVFFADADVAWREDPLEAVARLGLAPAGDNGGADKKAKKGTAGKKVAASAENKKWTECEVTWQPNKDHEDIVGLLRETERVDTPAARTIALNGAANTGVFLLRPTETALELMAAWEAELDYKTHGNDQPAMNAVLLRRWKDLGAKLCTLPPKMFPTGYTLLKSGVPEEAVGVHMNYVVGVKRKAEWAERLGLARRLDQVPLSVLSVSSAAVVLADAKDALAEQERSWRLAQCQLQDRRAVVDVFVAEGGGRKGDTAIAAAGARVNDFERSLPLIAKAMGDFSADPSASSPLVGIALVIGGNEAGEDGGGSSKFAGDMSGVTVVHLPSSAATTLNAHVREQCDEQLNGLFCLPLFYLRLNLDNLVNVASKDVLFGMRSLLAAHFFNVITAVVPVNRLRSLVSGLSNGGVVDVERGGYEVFLLGGKGALYPVSRGYWDDAYVTKLCVISSGGSGGGCAAEIVAVPRGSAWVPALLSAGSDYSKEKQKQKTEQNGDDEHIAACLLSRWNEGNGEAGTSRYSYDPPPSGLNAWKLSREPDQPARIGTELDESGLGVIGGATASAMARHLGVDDDASRGGCGAGERMRGGPMHRDVCRGVHRGDVFTWLAAAHSRASAVVIGAHRGGAGAKRTLDGRDGDISGDGDGDAQDDKEAKSKAKKRPAAGRDRDPGWDALTSPAMSAWRKVFVEPVPQMFRKLEGAIKRVNNATAVNAALSRRSGKRWMYCPSMNRDGRLVVAGAAARLPQWLDETCSMDPSRFTGGGKGDENTAEVGGSNALLGIRSMRRLRRNIHKLRVDTITMGELLRRQGISPAEVQYVQVDAGGFDDVVVRQVLALGGGCGLGRGTRKNTTTAPATAAGLCSGPRVHPTPAVIVYDTDLLDEGRRGSTLRLLHRHGYSTCREGENTVAVRMSSI